MSSKRRPQSKGGGESGKNHTRNSRNWGRNATHDTVYKGRTRPTDRHPRTGPAQQPAPLVQTTHKRTAEGSQSARHTWICPHL